MHVVFRPTITAAVGLIAVVGTLSAEPGGGNVSARVRELLRTHLEASDSELTALVQGRPVAKTLTATANREMTTAGGIRIRGTGIERFVSEFKTLDGFRTSQFVLQIGKFGAEPMLSDLDPLTIEPDDIESLRKCKVAACDVQLGANDIRRFNNEVKWAAPTAARDAAVLYKAVLFAHLGAYRAGGLERLLSYNDREAPVPLPIETKALLDAKPSFIDHLPAFDAYIRRYPAIPLGTNEDFFYWSKEAFGFKPVVSLNHVSVYRDAATGEVMIAIRQLYASHYIDGSVAIHALIPDSGPDGAAFYWLYLNRSRVGRLAGFLGTISRPIVQRRARAGLNKSLLQTKQRLEAPR
jgi:hypothetical protein